MRPLLIAAAIALGGCNALGGIPPETVGAVANAGGGCVKVQGLWGSGIVIVGNADKGVIRNGKLTVAGDCQGVSIEESRVAPVPPVAPVKPVP